MMARNLLFMYRFLLEGVWNAGAHCFEGIAPGVAGRRLATNPGGPLMSGAAVAGIESREDELVNRYATLVKRIARHLIIRLPDSVQLDDLVQAGLIGLMEATRHYDPSQGASFETYATIRIRGAMLDELRRNDWSPRSLSRRVRLLADATNDVENEKGGSATSQEIAERLSLSLDEYHQWVREANNQNFFSLDAYDDMEIPGNGGGDTTYHNIEIDKRRSYLSEAIGTLSGREQMVLSLYYDKDMTLKEIGQVLGVSESRVCQIHGEATLRLRTRMGSWR